MLLTTKKVITKKLFYKKWMYKVVIKCGGIAQLRRRGLDYISTVKTISHGSPYVISTNRKIISNRKALIDIAGHLENNLTLGEYQIRVEGDTCAIFTNTKQMLDNLIKDLKSYIVEYHEPEDNKSAIFLSSNKNKIVCSQLPHAAFKYKIYFKNGDIKNHNTLRGFLSWADKLNDKIYIPTGSRRIINGDDHPYFYGHYFYAKDQKITSMAMMMLSEHLQKTEEYVLKSELI